MTRPLLQELQRHALTIGLSRRSVLFRSGESCIGVYIVRRGRISLRWVGEHKVLPFDSVGPGAVIGLPAALRGAYDATARAVEDAQLGFVPVDRVNRLLDSNPQLCRMAMELIAGEIRKMLLLSVDISIGGLPAAAADDRQTGTGVSGEILRR